jgi:carbonic anhydrase/acetyltransferase-like protein (isoleucine patch superfamily)
VIVGKVKIGRDVFVGPGAVIRADEPGSSIVVEDNCNIQDKVVIHSLEGSSVRIGEDTSLTHGCIIHGPCKIGKGSFVGFGSVVFDSELGEGVFVGHSAVVKGVTIPSERVVESGRVVKSRDDVKGLGFADKSLKDFARNVVRVNLDLVRGYQESVE